MLQRLDENLWHAQHRFTVAGVPISSRMTVVRLGSGALWLHSPIPLDAGLRAGLDALGPVRHLVAPNLHHYKFIAQATAAYPDAIAHGAPGLQARRAGLQSLHELGAAPEPAWRGEIDHVLVKGMPLVNELAFFHRESATLILTDLCQCMSGELPWRTRIFAMLVGVRDRLAVPRMVRLVTRDRAAAGASLGRVLDWPFERAVLAHDVVIEHNAKTRLANALSWFGAAREK